MVLLTQPENSRSCGQHCIAMITGLPLEEVIAAVGHDRGTYTKDVIRGFNALGLKVPISRLKPIRKNAVLPQRCILKIKWLGHKRGHWVAYENGMIYDPIGFIHPYHTEAYSAYKVPGKITAYLPIEK